MSSPRDWLTDRFLARLAALGRLDLITARKRTRWLRGPLRLLMRRRARIVRRNLELCFPELNPNERIDLEHAHFRQVAEAVAEIAYAWNHPGHVGPDIGEVHGLEHIEAARSDGQGIVLLTGHVTCLELGARLFGEQIRAHAMYRPLRNPKLEALQTQGRGRYAEGMFPRDQLRTMVRHLRRGGILWNAPDQDFGEKRSRFAPFFGIQTATATAISELARLGKARVVPMYPLKNPDTGKIIVTLEDHWSPFPSDDLRDDLSRYNAFLERNIRKHPAQYWWLHRRFKTAPEGEAKRYLD